MNIRYIRWADDAEIAEHRKSHYGVLSDRKRIDDLLGQRYTLCFYGPDGLLMYNPSPYGGGFMWIDDALAEEYGSRFDPHNWNVMQHRAARGEPESVHLLERFKLARDAAQVGEGR